MIQPDGVRGNPVSKTDHYIQLIKVITSKKQRGIKNIEHLIFLPHLGIIFHVKAK